jgi:predicted dehydrogenase
MTGRTDAVATAVAGMGNYAGRIINLLLRAEESTDHPPRLVAVTSSHPDRHPEMAEQLRSRGIAIEPSFDALLGRDDVEAVWLPIPIDLHLSFSRRVLEAGKAVLCEKPVAGCVDDCDAMIAERDRYRFPVAVGYQDIWDPATTALKQRILAGGLGRVAAVTVHGAWPRDSKYYGRADWSGRIKQNGVWVLDSPVQNAMNHFINLALFLLGPTPGESTGVRRIEAELYRARDIENYDTASLRLHLEGGAACLVLLTHATGETLHPVIRIDGDAGTAVWRFNGPTTWQERGGPVEVMAEPTADGARAAMVSRFNRLVRGVPDPSRAVATLEVARAPLVAVNGASEAAPVWTIPATGQEVLTAADGATTVTVPGIADYLAHCAAEGCMLHESGRSDWTRPAGEADLTGYRHFAGPFGSAG